jgi:hypothetical protein
VIADELERRAVHVWLDDDAGEPPTFEDTFDIPPVAFCAGEFGCTEAWASRAAFPPPGTDPGLIPPPNFGAVRQRPDYMAEHAWHSAMAKEVRCVEEFKRGKFVRFREYQIARRRFPGRASIRLLTASTSSTAVRSPTSTSLPLASPNSLSSTTRTTAMASSTALMDGVPLGTAL